jgi:hypothetical protein
MGPMEEPSIFFRNFVILNKRHGDRYSPNLTVILNSIFDRTVTGALDSVRPGDKCVGVGRGILHSSQLAGAWKSHYTQQTN